MKNLRQTFLKILIIFLVIFIDQLSKNLFYNTDTILLPNILGFRSSSLNTGGAWSVLNDKMWLLVVLTFVFLILVSVFDFFFKSKSYTYSVAFGLVLGGTIGNLIDRLFLGGVRDFLFFDFWKTYPTFNLADSFLLVGMILLCVFVIFIYKPKPKEDKK